MTASSRFVLSIATIVATLLLHVDTPARQKSRTIAMVGGTLAVESRPGAGTRVRVRVPVDAA